MMKIPFFRLGTWVHPLYGKLKITQETFDQMLANFKADVLGRPPFIRIGHDNGKSDKFGYAPAEGWVRDLKQEGDVLFAEVDPTTPESAENIRTKRFRFSSAEYNPNGVDRETGKGVGALLSAIALTNEPFLTRLPEATLLADSPETFYLDYQLSEGAEEMQEDKETKGLLQKLCDGIDKLLGVQQVNKPSENEPAKGNDELMKKLSAMEQNFTGLTGQLNLLAEENKALKTQLGTETGARLLAEVERQAAEMVAAGIPPVQVNTWKVLAQSDAGRSTIKLSEEKDGKSVERTVSQADVMREMLLALPPTSRVPMGQQGSTSAPAAVEEVKLAVDQDIKDMGGRIDESGRYVI